MLLTLHISAALAGILISSYAVISPSAHKIRLAGGLVLLTVISGTVIILENHLGLVSACLTGLLYIGFTGSVLALAGHRLAHQKIT